MYAFNYGTGTWNKGNNLNIEKNSITGDSSTGINFDPDNDGINEIIMNADGTISSSGTTISSGTFSTQYLTVTSTSSFSGLITGTEISVSTVSAKDSNGLYLLDDGNNGIFIKDGGNVGIGTTNPTSVLNVFNNTVNDPFPPDVVSCLRLTRSGVAAQSYSNAIDFNVTRYENPGGASDTASRTQLILKLAHGKTNIPDTNIMSLLSNGNVGIGITNPSQKLEVVGEVKANEVITSTVSASSSSGLWLVEDGGKGIFIEDSTGFVGIGQTNPSVDLQIGNGITTGIKTISIVNPNSVDSPAVYNATRLGRYIGFMGASLDGLGFGVTGSGFSTDAQLNAASDLFIDRTGPGNIGIGTYQATQKLDVVGIVKSSGVYARGADGLKLYDDGGNGIFIQDGGNVGIGTITPASSLQVVGGDIQISSSTVAKGIIMYDVDYPTQSYRLNVKSGTSEWTKL